MEAIIKVRDLRFAYGDKKVIDGVSFDIFPREFVSIIGPNGSGKTTLLKLLHGSLPPQAGTVCLGETPISKMRKRALARKIGVVSQQPRFHFEITALELVLMGRSPHKALLAFEGKEDFEIAHEAMVLTGVEDFKDRNLFTLSGGEFQRVMVARALAQKPQIMLLDEPTSYLDIKHQIGLCRLLKTMNRDHGIAIVSVFHDINLASDFSDRIIVMKDGKIRGVGTPDEVITKELLEPVYDCRIYVDKNPVAGTPRITVAGE